MNPRSILVFIFTAVFAATSGWFAARHLHPSPKAEENTNARKVLYYQSAMHPWIKSDKPGNCTICGMKLTPIYEGEKGFETSADIVALPSNSVTVVHVQTEPVQRRKLSRTLRVAGRIDDNDTRHRFVSAYVDGRVDKLFVNFVGAEVLEGEPLAAFYSPALLTSEREYLTLLRDQHSMANASVLGLEQTNLLASATQRLRRLGLTTEQITRLEHKPSSDTHSQISAPMSGTVVQRFVYEGQYVKEGDKLFEIADFSTMWFLFDVYERDLAWIQTGQTVEVTTPSVPGKVFTAPIAFIDPNLNDVTRSARVRVEIPNPLAGSNGIKRRLLSHRLFADGVVQSETPEVLALPRSAVIAPGPRAVAYVELRAGSYQQRRLKLAQFGDDYWEVLEGVSEGERVVIAGNMLIDAQSQLNRTALESKRDAGATTEKLEVAHKKAAHDFLRLAEGLSAALAADDLNRFQTEAAKVPADLLALKQTFASMKSWQALVDAINAAGSISAADDLRSARKAFLPFSEAAAAFAKQLRRSDAEFGTLKVFRCSMAGGTFPGAPSSAEWVQSPGPVRNPFFGAAMLDCGTEVQP